MSEHTLSCPNCRHDIDVEKWATTTSCSYCGAVIEDIPRDFFEPHTEEEDYDHGYSKDDKGQGPRHPYPEGEKRSAYERHGPGERVPPHYPPRQEGPYGSAPTPYPYPPPPYQGLPVINPYKQMDVLEGLSRSFKLFTSHFSTFIGYWSIPICLLLILSVVQYVYVTEFLGGEPSTFPWEFDEEKDESDFSMGNLLLLLLLSLFLFFLNWFILILFFGGAVAITAEILEKGKSSPRTGFRALQKNVSDVLFISFAFSAMFTLGFLLVLVGAVLVCYWYIFAMVIFMLEGKNAKNVFDSSKRFSKMSGSILFILILFVLYFLVTFAISAILMVIIPSSLVVLAFAKIIDTLLLLIVFITLVIFYVSERERLGRMREMQDQYYYQTPPPPPQSPYPPHYPPR